MMMQRQTLRRMSQMHSEMSDDDRRVAEFLLPLEGVRPVSRPARRRLRAHRVALIAAGAVLIGAGGALAGTQLFNPGEATVRSEPDPLTCSGVIGEPAADAASYLGSRGYRVSWRLQSWGRHVEGSSGGVVSVSGGHSSVESGPPPGSVVWDVVPFRGPKSVVVMTMDPNDPNAPRVVPPKNC